MVKDKSLRSPARPLDTTLYYKGRALADATHLEPNATIALTSGAAFLPGGSKQHEEAAPFASFMMYPDPPNVASRGMAKWMGIDALYTSSPPVIKDPLATLEVMKTIFEAQLERESGMQYKFTYYINNVAFNFEGDPKVVNELLAATLAAKNHT